MGTGNSVRAKRRARGKVTAYFKRITRSPRNILEAEDGRIVKAMIVSARQAGLLHGNR